MLLAVISIVAAETTWVKCDGTVANVPNILGTKKAGLNTGSFASTRKRCESMPACNSLYESTDEDTAYTYLAEKFDLPCISEEGSDYSVYFILERTATY